MLFYFLSLDRSEDKGCPRDEQQAVQGMTGRWGCSRRQTGELQGARARDKEEGPPCGLDSLEAQEGGPRGGLGKFGIRLF